MKNEYLPRVLMDEIFTVTRQIQVKFPELYQVLEETPLFMADTEKIIHSTDFEKYLESIRNQMTVFEKDWPDGAEMLALGFGNENIRGFTPSQL